MKFSHIVLDLHNVKNDRPERKLKCLNFRQYKKKSTLTQDDAKWQTTHCADFEIVVFYTAVYVANER